MIEYDATDLATIRAELAQIAADAGRPNYLAPVEHFTSLWANVGRHVPALVAEVEAHRSSSQAHIMAALLAAARAEGYAHAITLLRDGQAYMDWVRIGQRDATQQHRSAWGTSDVMWAADYLEAMAVDHG